MNEKRSKISTAQGIAHYGTLAPEGVDELSTVLAEAGATSAYLVPSNWAVGFTNEAGQAVAYLCRSYVIVTPRAAVQPVGDRPTTDHIEPGGVDVFLTTVAPSGTGGGAHTAPERLGTVCPVHFVTMSLTGACDACG